ncbi:hypothetical protein Ahy_B08g091322 [Arachis hypogaea]|uniref:CCHC-type domain-containing protein n=1 Tax=Arachis hypogaea TaxID=3818 RepID=A0A444Y1X2_ARAHY|nr:hypothetical protein Ahy_B08g091322 [Arachis hypogaea]
MIADHYLLVQRWRPLLIPPREKNLVPSFSALGKEFRLEYEGLHLICFNCGRYGHKYDGCLEKMKAAEDRQQSQAATEEQNHQEGENAAAVQGQSASVNTGSHVRKDLIATENLGVMEVAIGTVKKSHEH